MLNVKKNFVCSPQKFLGRSKSLIPFFNDDNQQSKGNDFNQK